MTTNGEDEPLETHRVELLMQLLVFQGKLILDGLRDIVLMPVAIIAVVAGLFGRADKPDRYFRQVLHFGRRSEVWINLFGTRRSGSTSDKLVAPLQQKLLDEVQRGGGLTKATRGMNRTLDSLSANRRDKKTEAASDRADSTNRS